MTIFFYAGAEQKGKLIGASETDISKPWMHQSHINAADAEHVLKHEMAHLFAAEFGWSPLRISKKSGLIEGTAVAADGAWFEDSVHRTASLVFASGAPVDAVSILDSFGFASLYAGISYTLAGSFCSFLVDSYGIEKFKRLYATGSYQAVYGRECSDLASEWEQFIRRLPVTSSDSMKARYFFRRGSIFQKECVRVIADLNQATRHFMSDHDYERALASAEHSLNLSRTPEAVLQKVNVLFELRKFQDVLTFIHLQESGMPVRDSLHSGTALWDLLPMHLRAGDALWVLDSLEQAKHEYEALLSLHLTMGYDEAVQHASGFNRFAGAKCFKNPFCLYNGIRRYGSKHEAFAAVNAAGKVYVGRNVDGKRTIFGSRKNIGISGRIVPASGVFPAPNGREGAFLPYGKGTGAKYFSAGVRTGSIARILQGNKRMARPLYFRAEIILS